MGGRVQEAPACAAEAGGWLPPNSSVSVSDKCLEKFPEVESEAQVSKSGHQLMCTRRAEVSEVARGKTEADLLRWDTAKRCRLGGAC